MISKNQSYIDTRNSKKTDDSYLQVIKEKLLEGFRDEDDFSFMKGYKPWENLIYK